MVLNPTRVRALIFWSDSCDYQRLAILCEPEMRKLELCSVQLLGKERCPLSASSMNNLSPVLCISMYHDTALQELYSGDGEGSVVTDDHGCGVSTEAASVSVPYRTVWISP